MKICKPKKFHINETIYDVLTDIINEPENGDNFDGLISHYFFDNGCEVFLVLFGDLFINIEFLRSLSKKYKMTQKEIKQIIKTLVELHETTEIDEIYIFMP